MPWNPGLSIIPAKWALLNDSTIRYYSNHFTFRFSLQATFSMAKRIKHSPDICPVWKENDGISKMQSLSWELLHPPEKREDIWWKREINIRRKPIYSRGYSAKWKREGEKILRLIHITNTMWEKIIEVNNQIPSGRKEEKYINRLKGCLRQLQNLSSWHSTTMQNSG